MFLDGARHGAFCNVTRCHATTWVGAAAGQDAVAAQADRRRRVESESVGASLGGRESPSLEGTRPVSPRVAGLYMYILMR